MLYLILGIRAATVSEGKVESGGLRGGEESRAHSTGSFRETRKVASGCQDLPRISALRMPGAARQNRLARGKTGRWQTIPTRSVETGKGSEGGDAG